MEPEAIDHSRRTQEVEALRVSGDLLATLGATRCLSTGLARILEAACRMPGIDGGALYLQDTHTDGFTLAAHRGWPSHLAVPAPHLAAGSRGAALIREGQAVYPDERELVPARAILSGEERSAGTRALALLPVLHEGRAVAALVLASRTHDTIPPALRPALEEMTACLGGAVARLQSEETHQESERRYRELAALLPEVVFEMDDRGNLRFTNEQAFAVFQASHADFERGINIFDFVAPADHARVTANMAMVLRGEKPPSNEYSLLRKDGSAFPALIYSAPILRDNRPIGLRGFLVDITSRKRAEEELRQRSDQLEAMRAITADVTQELDLTTLLRLLIVRAIALLGTPAGAVYLWDEAEGVLIPRAWHGYGGWLGELRLRPGQGVVGRVAEGRSGLIVNDYQTDPRALPLLRERAGATAALAEPLLYRDRLLGVIVLNHLEPGRSLAQADGELLRLFASQAAIAIENARLHTAAVERGTQLDALLRATRSVMSGLDLQEILHRIVIQAADIARTPHVTLLLLDRSTRALRLAAQAGKTVPDSFQVPLGADLSGRVAETGEPVFSPDSPNDPRNLLAERDRGLGLSTYLGLPVRGRDEVLGVLTFETTASRRYSPEELAYLTSFADQAAIAIQNARLFQGEQTRRKELEAVRAVGEEIARELDLTALLRLIYDRAVELVDGDAGAIYLWDEATQVLIPQGWHGFGEWVADLRLRPGEGVAGAVAARRQGMIVNDFRTSAHAHPVFLERSAHVAVLGEPFLYRDRLVGVIAITRNDPGRPFTADDQRLVRLFATQAAIAIQNARLFEEQRQAYTQLQQAQAELIRAEKLRALGELAAGVAHDLNNMLAVILGQADLLRLQVADPQIQSALAPLTTAAADGAQVVRRLQDFARQRPHPTLGPVALPPVLQEALAITRPRWKDDPERHGSSIQVEADLPALPPVLGHAPEIREALTNLILNAVDAMPHGGRLRFQGSLAGPWVELSVTDTGSGMAEAVQRRIFEPFFTTKGGKGTGLGLSMVYGIMERHGGSVQVRSAPGRGATFILRFQVASSTVPEPPAAAAPPSSPRRILLIDDDPAVRKTVASLLRATGHQVLEASDGPGGLERLGEGPVDLVLTDLGMPEMSGWEVAQAIKARSPRLPVVLLTGWGEHTQMPLSEIQAVDRILGKPVRLPDLLQVVADLSRPAQDAAP